MRREPPQPMAFTLKGQRYVQTGTEPHERPSGRVTSLLVFETRCPVCDTPFSLKASRRRAEERSVVRRCPAHRQLGLTVERHQQLIAAEAQRSREAALMAMFE